MFFFYLLIFTMPFYHHPLFDQGAGPVTVVKAIGALAAGWAMIYGIQKGFPNIFAMRNIKVFGVLLLWAIISFVRMGIHDYNVDPMFSYMSLFAFMVATLILMDSLKKVSTAVYVSVAATAFASLYILREWQKYHDLYSNFRPGYVVGDPNYFTLAAMLTVPLGYYWWRIEKRPFWRWSMAAMLVAVSIAIALSASRGGLVSIGIFCLYAIWTSKRRWRNAAILAAILLPPMVVIPHSPLSRIIHPDTATIKSNEKRMEVLRAGLEMVKEHPILGVGLGHYKQTSARMFGGRDSDGRIAHNTYLEMAAELGAIGLLIYVWLLLETFRIVHRLRKWALKVEHEFIYSMATAMEGGLAAYVFGSFFLSAEYVKFFWFYIVTVSALAMIATRIAANNKPKTMAAAA